MSCVRDAVDVDVAVYDVRYGRCCFESGLRMSFNFQMPNFFAVHGSCSRPPRSGFVFRPLCAHSTPQSASRVALHVAAPAQPLPSDGFRTGSGSLIGPSKYSTSKSCIRDKPSDHFLQCSSCTRDNPPTLPHESSGRGSCSLSLRLLSSDPRSCVLSHSRALTRNDPGLEGVRSSLFHAQRLRFCV